MNLENRTEKQEEALGQKIIEILNLKVREGRVDVGEFGTKTPLGLGRVILRLVEETD